MRLVAARRLATLAGLAVTAVATVVAGVALVAAPAQADPATGSVEWGLKESWRNYILGVTVPPPGQITIGGGATGSNGVATFPVTDRTGDTVSVDGSIAYVKSGHGFQVTLSNLRIELDGTGGGAVYADFVHVQGAPTPNPPVVGTTTNFTNVKIVTLQNGVTVGNVTTFETYAADINTVTTFDSDAYKPGTRFDDLKLTITTDEPPATATPAPQESSTPASSESAAPTLPVTGSNVGAIAAVGAALVLAGVLLVVTLRRRRNASA
jgi:LPXTG-motif cell wall-anchored protein